MALFGLDERAQGEWSSIYLIIIFVIAVLLLIGIVKPMFKNSQNVVQNQPVLNK